MSLTRHERALVRMVIDEGAEKLKGCRPEVVTYLIGSLVNRQMIAARKSGGRDAAIDFLEDMMCVGTGNELPANDSGVQ